MKVRHYSELEKLFAGTHPIREDSPELLFIRAVCAGKVDEALSFFAPLKLFNNEKPVVDAPYARYEGLDEIRKFVEDFNPTFHATESFAVPCIQTIANGRAALEVSINFTVDGEINQIPMFVVADFRTPKMLDEVRIYCYYSMVPGMTPYRKPMFVSAHREMGDPNLLTGAVREYYEALHHLPAVDVDKIVNSMEDEIIMGGYQYYAPEKLPNGTYVMTKEGERKTFSGMQPNIPSGIMMRYETIIDDGKTCVIEWMHVVSRRGREIFNRISLSCVSAYERGDDGKLCSIRILDYAGKEKEIDWERTPLPYDEAKEINFVETQHAGCGERPQYDRK